MKRSNVFQTVLQKVERALEVLKDAPGVDPAMRNGLESRPARLRAENVRLLDRLKDQGLVMEAYGAARSLSAQGVQKRVRSIQARASEADRGH